jgi:hypothetical protein
MPLGIFIKHVGDPDLLVYTGIGILLCVGYALSSLSNITLGEDVLNMFFIFFLSITLLGLENRKTTSPDFVPKHANPKESAI